MTDGVSTTNTLVVHERDAVSNSDLTYGVDCSPFLPSGTSLSSVSVLSVIPGDMTIANEAINSGTLTDNDGTTTVSANKGISFTKTGGRKGRKYTVEFTVTTTGGSVFGVTVPIRVD